MYLEDPGDLPDLPVSHHAIPVPVIEPEYDLARQLSVQEGLSQRRPLTSRANKKSSLLTFAAGVPCSRESQKYLQLQTAATHGWEKQQEVEANLPLPEGELGVLVGIECPEDGRHVGVEELVLLPPADVFVQGLELLEAEGGV